jgi:hypothetical protein
MKPKQVQQSEGASGMWALPKLMLGHTSEGWHTELEIWSMTIIYI